MFDRIKKFTTYIIALFSEADRMLYSKYRIILVFEWDNYLPARPIISRCTAN